MTLDEFNSLGHDEAVSTLRTAAHVPDWADAVATARPFSSVDALLREARLLGRDWGAAEVDQAMVTHPRIGEAPQGQDEASEHSRREQSAMSTADPEVTERIAAGNVAYEEKFGRVFLIRAAGRGPEEILAALERRLHNDPEIETLVVARELLDIADLRLREALA